MCVCVCKHLGTITRCKAEICPCVFVYVCLCFTCASADQDFQALVFVSWHNHDTIAQTYGHNLRYRYVYAIPICAQT